MNNFGWIYGVAVERDNSDRSGDKPSALQISLGLDSESIEVPHGKIEISEKYQFFSMSISGLKADTGYALYVIGGNAHPGYPDLMEEKFVETILFTTEPAPPVEYLDLGDDLR